jgi:hypothetical protein
LTTNGTLQVKDNGRQRDGDNVKAKEEDAQQCQSKEGGHPTMSKQRWRMTPDNVKAKMGEDTRQCQSKDGGGYLTMSK